MLLLCSWMEIIFLNSASSRPTITIGKLVVVNPATSYDRTRWPILGPLIANSGSVFPALGVGNTLLNYLLQVFVHFMTATIAVAALQPQQVLNIGRRMISRINSSNTAVDEVSVLLQSFSRASEQLPADTLQWRLKEWLLLGTFLMNEHLICSLFAIRTGSI